MINISEDYVPSNHSLGDYWYDYALQRMVYVKKPIGFLHRVK